MNSPAAPTLEIHLTEDELRASLENDVRTGLLADEKWLPPVWFYDERGSYLFDQITTLPEYYPTRAERHLLETYSKDIAARSLANTLVELGAGTCDKSRILIDALGSIGTLNRFVPLDVSDATLWSAANRLVEDYPNLSVNAVVGDFHRHLGKIPTGGRRLIAFLGGTIGNLLPLQRSRFLFDLDCQLEAGDSFLIGTDLVKDEKRLVAAYDDSTGVTAEFNRNVLRVLNRRLGAQFNPDSFEHVAIWNEEESWIEMRLRSRVEQVVPIADLEIEVSFASGEDLLTEISAKFTREGLQEELWSAGFLVDTMWEEPDGDFLLTLATPYC